MINAAATGISNLHTARRGAEIHLHGAEIHLHGAEIHRGAEIH